MKRRRWLLDVTIGGQLMRFASSPITVVDRSGESLLYAGGLSVGTVSVLADSVGVSISEPMEGPSWAERHARGQQFELARAVLRLHAEGDELEDAPQLLGGVVSAATWGWAGDPLAFTLQAVAPGGDGQVPRAGSVVKENTTWPRGGNSLNPEDVGRYYPVVFGYPGAGSDDVYPAYRAPLVLVDTTSGRDIWVIGDKQLVATDVELFVVDSSSTPPEAAQAFDDVAFDSDGVGHEVTVARTTTVATDPTLGAEYWCGHSLASGGGLPNLSGTGPIRGADEVIERLLRDYSQMPVDRGRMAAVAPLLNAYLLDGYIDEPIGTWDYISRAILPLLPVVPRWSSEGFYLQHMDYGADATRVVAFLDADREDIQRTSGLSARFDVFNRFTISFGLSRNGYQEMRTLTGSPAANNELFPGQISDPRVIGDARCQMSQARYGPLDDTPLETGILWDAPTALLVLRHRAQKHALPIIGMQYVCGEVGRRIVPGDIVQVNDSDVSIANRLALVEDVAHSLGETVLELSILPDVPR